MSVQSYIPLLYFILSFVDEMRCERLKIFEVYKFIVFACIQSIPASKGVARHKIFIFQSFHTMRSLGIQRAVFTLKLYRTFFKDCGFV